MNNIINVLDTQQIERFVSVGVKRNEVELKRRHVKLSIVSVKDLNIRAKRGMFKVIVTYT